MSKKKVKNEFVEESIVHLVDKKPSGLTTLLKSCFHPMWKLFVGIISSLACFYYFILMSFQDCNGTRKKVLITFWSYLLFTDVILILDTILTVLGKARLVHQSRKYPIWLIIGNVLSSIPMYSFLPAPDNCRNPPSYLIFAVLKSFSILSYLVVVFRSYRIDALQVTCVTTFLYVANMCILACIYEESLDYFSIDFLKVRHKYNSSKTDLEYYSLFFNGFVETFTPIEKYVNLINYRTSLSALSFVAMIGSCFLWFLVTLESIPAIFMVHHWRKTFLAHFQTGASCGIKEWKLDLEKVGKNTIEKKRRKDWIAVRSENKLKESVYLDLCLQYHYTALVHCDLFRDMEVSFLSALASRCVVRSFQEDDIIFAENELKDCMIYVESGTLGLADPEESDVPVFFLDAGSLLGEASLVRVYHNSLIVSCASIEATLHILHRNAFLEVCNNFPLQLKEIIKAVNERFVIAYKFVFYARYVMIGHPEVDLWKRPESRMVWIQNALNHMYKARLATPPEEEPEYEWDPTLWNSGFHDQMPEHLGRMPLYLSKLVPVPLASIFRKHSPPILKDGFVPIIYKHSLHMDRWEQVYVITSVFFLLFWPIRLLYGVYSPISNYQYFFQFIFTLDFLLYLFAAEKNFQGIVIDKFSELFAVKLFRHQLWIRFLCSVPIDFILMTDVVFKNPATLAHIGLYQITQLICVVRVFKSLKHLKTKYVRNIFIFQFLENIILLLYFSYVIGVTMLVVTCWNHECDKKGWFYKKSKVNLIDDSQDVITVIASLFVGLEIVLDINRSADIRFTSDKVTDTVFSYIFCGLGLAMKIYLYNSTLYSVITSQTQSYIWDSNVKRIKYYLYSKKVKWTTLQRVERFLRMKWKCSQLTVRENQTEEEVLRAKFKIICQHPIFSWMSKDHILDLLKKARTSYYPPNEVIVYKGQQISEIYIIEKGNCTNMPEPIGGSTMKTKGYLFGLPEMLLDKPSYQTIVTTSSTVVIILPFNHFYESLKSYPAVFHAFSAEFEKKFGMAKSLAGLQTFDREFKFEVYLLRPFIPNFESISVPAFGSPLAKEYFHPFKTSNFGGTYHFFLSNWIVHPNGKFYILWESFLFFIYVLYIVTVPVKSLIKLVSPISFYVGFSFVFIISIVDMYLKFHLAYFNENGFLVKHPVRTAQNYLRNDFILDIASTIPFVFHDKTYLYLAHILKIVKVFKFIRTIEVRVGHKLSSLAFVKYCLIIGTLANIVAVYHLEHKCDTGTPPFSKLKVNCKYDSGKQIYDEHVPIFYAFFHVTFIFQIQLQHLHVTPPSIDWFIISDWRIYVPMTIFVLFNFIFYKSVVASDHFSDANLVYRYGVKVKRLKRFMKMHKVPKFVSRNCLLYFRKMWGNQLCIKHINLFQSFDDSPLGLDILFDIYGETFTFSPIPNAATTFYKNLLKMSNIYVFVEKSVVMRENDVVNSVYIVHSGYAYCYDKQKRVSGVLTRGDVFGALHDLQEKLPYTIIPQTDMEIIAIGSEHFFGTLHQFDIIKKQFNRYLTRRVGSSGAGEKLEREVSAELLRRQLKRERKILGAIELARFLFTVVIYGYTVLIVGMLEENLVVHIVLYILELIRLVLLILFHTLWKKKESHGLTDRIDYTTIRRSRIDFMYDLVATFPLDFIYFLYWREMKGLTFLCLKINRIMEIKVFYDYLKRHPYRFLRRFALVNTLYEFFVVLLLLHSYFCALAFVDITVKGKIQTFEERLIVYVTQVFNFLVVICQFDVWIVEEWTEDDVSFSTGTYTRAILLCFLIMIPAVFMCHMLFAMLSREFYKLFRLFLIVSFKFTRIVDEVTGWTRQSQCPVMTDAVKDYFDYLWYGRNGEDFPSLLVDAPFFVKGPILSHIYNGLLKRAVFFRGFSPDLLRQMCLHMDYHSYCPGDIVVRKNNVNRTMYLVLKGKVQALEAGYRLNSDETMSYKEKIRCELMRGDMFGMEQGLSLTPYRLTYRSFGFSTVISLKYNDWSHLLSHFPQEKLLLDERINQINQEDSNYWDCDTGESRYPQV